MMSHPVVAGAVAALLLGAAVAGAPQPATIGSYVRDVLGVEQSIIAEHDLNGDGVAEAIVYATEPRDCGSGGCNLLVLARGERGWRPVSRMSVARLPVELLPEITAGWHDLAVTVAGGGITQPRRVRLRFDGDIYPANPTTVDDPAPVESGMVLIER